MVEIVWTNPALEDLNDIAEYIALSNLQSAKKLALCRPSTSLPNKVDALI